MTLPNFKTSYKATEIKAVCTGERIENRLMEQSRETKTDTYSQLIFIKGIRTCQWRRDVFFQKKCVDNWTSICKKKVNLDTDFTPVTK